MLDKHKLVVVIGSLALGFTTLSLASDESISMATAAKKSANPVSDVWMLITQNDLTYHEREDGEHEMQNRFSFQPVMPVPIMDGEWNLVNRLVLNHYTNPGDMDSGSADINDVFFNDHTTGFGDAVLLSMAAPNRDDGWIWGLGPTVIMPSGSDGFTQDKWQVGPAALVAHLGSETNDLTSFDSWNLGILAQHWWDVGGSDDVVESTNQSDIQYFLNFRVSETALIGMTPNIQIDWEKEGSDRFKVPVGIGYIGMLKMGSVPVRWGVELQYYAIKPDADRGDWATVINQGRNYDPYTPDWNVKVFIAPVTQNPFK